MKKAEAENAIRGLCHQWAEECSIRPDPNKGPLDFHPSFPRFKTWAYNKGFGCYFKFRSLVGADYDAEIWFDQEFKQTWRR